MAYYVSAKSAAEQREVLKGVDVIVIGNDLKPLQTKKNTPTPPTKVKGSRYKGKY